MTTNEIYLTGAVRTPIGTFGGAFEPVSAPVLGGILVADEVIDLLLPVIFYWVRRARWRRIHDRA